jgi:anti-anti-sigma factor
MSPSYRERGPHWTAPSRPRAQVVVDLAKVPTIDPAGLGILVRAPQAARCRHGDLLLAGLSRYVGTVMRTMQLHTAFTTFDTVQQALTAADAMVGQPTAPVGGAVRR